MINFHGGFIIPSQLKHPFFDGEGCRLKTDSGIGRVGSYLPVERDQGEMNDFQTKYRQEEKDGFFTQ